MPDLSTKFSPNLLALAITAKRTGMRLRIVDVAKALTISKQTIIKIEKGDPKVNFINVLRVMELLGLSFDITTDESQLKPADQQLGEHDDQWF
ncbi:MAG: helix-turn-helix domain-containing protein [Gammaproteobacteria bacterium]|nr:helix-turn-helix domain-containing protein [Gammaproteobacteria bacterium]